MAAVTISLAIAIETPLSVGAGGSSGTLADTSVLRDGWGRPIIPGSQVKGKARHAAAAIARALGWRVAEVGAPPDPAEPCEIQLIFGAPGRLRSPLRFADLALVEPDAPPDLGIDAGWRARAGQIRHSVSISRRRGVAEDRRLLMQETVAAPAQFANLLAVAGELEREPQLALLLAGLRLSTRWGGAKSRGLGWGSVTATASWGGQEFDDERLARALREWRKA